ncbi:MAG TPA: nucleoside phosphorylase [Chitinophagaceae bacterium]|jgi:uridine phosphorylase|nr:MAG: Uridine phosphorylase [Bacteroidetes bacterium ADurb.BinA245]HMW67114.1 nucleoside phosphorylase [Chitinophagaceae bacterium]HNA91730.1 nucleoside phosphorylase [Chitinophagaceae bacterium]HNC37788.1 nucleoside phosphorylase [Chitinophagaceae bacterium]HND96130.1 nucleoside phosphorylase [Chitinophagaceae bacterium]
MSRIAESELIINDRGAVYHLDLTPDEIAGTVVTVGDPDRVKEISKYFDSIEVKRQHREFVSHTGYVGKKRITVLSSGIGPDNIDIVINELDALVNIDFKTREIKKELSSINIIRLGTSGSLQADVPVDSFVASTHGLGVDNLLNFYRLEQNDEEQQLLHHFVTYTQVHGQIGHPYISSGAASLIKNFVSDFHHGITVTCPGFYGPQGRVLRLGIRNPDFVNRLTDFRFGPHRITNFEMETSAIYGLGRLLGHHCLAINAIVANRVVKEFSKDGKAAVESLIKKFIGIFADSI